MYRELPLAAVLLIGLGGAANALDPQGAAVPHEPAPGGPTDAKSGAEPPQAAASDEQQQMLARCSDELKANSQAAGNPAAIQEKPEAHAQRVRAMVKLYVADELAKANNGKRCLAVAGQARELLASADELSTTSGSSR